jgi:nicotinate phosphoribosyltransferase
MLSFSITGSYTDLYEITMGEVAFLQHRQNLPVVFDYFFRTIPAKGGYAIFAGLQDVLQALAELRFTPEDIAFLRDRNFNAGYLDYLQRFRFRGRVYAVREGEVIFPHCPVLRVEGDLFETQLVETLLLNLLNFQSLVATKASRMRYVAGERILSDFGFRRAHGPGGILAARAAVIGGFQSTSNVYAAELYGIEASGTMAHAFIESYGSELEAFRAFAASRPQGCVFLVDTYDTLKSGLPNAITAAKEMEERGHRALGIRLDSGDLAYLAAQARRMLDEAGLPYMKIAVSNQLDEYVIKSLLDQQAPIDIFGVGTRLVTGHPDAALDGVYKLALVAGRPTMKFSETPSKLTLPGIKQVRRVFDKDGLFFGADIILLEGQGGAPVPAMYHPFEPGKSLDTGHLRQEPLLQLVMEEGEPLHPASPPEELAAYCHSRLNLLPAEYKRFENPHRYKVGLSKRLLQLREETRERHNHF